MAYDYEGRMDFRGDTVRALEFARDVLVRRGLKVLPLSGNELHFENPAFVMSTKKDPLLMVSKGVITSTGSALSMQAELGNLRALVKFTALLILALTIPEVAVMAVVFVMVVKDPGLLWICLLTVAPLPFIMPLVSKVQRRKTSRALDALLCGAAEAGGKK